MSRKLLLAGIITLGLSGCVSVSPNPFAGQKDLKKASRINTQLGSAYLRQGNYVRAKDKLQLAQKQDPDYALAFATMAQLYNQQGLTDRARQEYHKAMDLAPDDPNLNNRYGTFLCQHGHPKKGIEHFMNAAHNSSYNTPQVAWGNAGVCERHQNNLDKAAAYFRKSLQLNPEYAPSIEQLADLSYSRGHYMQAKALMKRYEKLAEPTASSLLLNVGIHHALGENQKAFQYAHQLEVKFPTSPELGHLEQALGK